MKQKVMVLGDIHAHWKRLNNLIRDQKPDIILQCGDFGFWPKFKDYSLKQINPRDTKIYFCDGNHEDMDTLLRISENKLESIEVAPNIFYQPRGSVLELEGKHIMFMGGALSIDKAVRTPYLDWFPEEIITMRQFYNALDNVNNYPGIDFIISHTCPESFKVEGTLPRFSNEERDACRVALDEMFKVIHPESWFFAHWHYREQGEVEGCRWQLLDTIDEGVAGFTWL